MDVSPMSITPAGTPGEAPSDSALSITSADSKTQLRRSGDPSGSGSGEGHGHGRSYFRRTSLAIAAARRFTLYEAVAATPGSPISPINSRVHFGDTLPSPVNARPQPQPQQIAAPTPTSTSPTSRFGVSFGTSFFNRSSGVPVRYASPLQESEEERQGQGQGQGQDEEAAIGATGETAYGAERAHTAATATPTRRKPTRGATSSSFRPPGTPMTPRRRRSSVVQARYRWLSGGSNTGDEPGVDVRSERDQEAYGHLKGKTHITVVDYSCDPDVEDTNVRVDFDGERLSEWLNCHSGQRPMKEGKPAGVRWLHVSGLNWEVVKTLTLKYGLHPLAVEDALRSSRHPRSKCDFYPNHLYLQILLYHIHAPDRAALARVAEGIPEGVVVPCDESGIPEHHHKSSWRWAWPWTKDEGAIRLPEGVDYVFEFGASKHADQEANRLVVERLTASYMVPIRRGILSIFMLRDGTLISISAHEIHEALAPIYERLEDEHSLLRRSNDVSMLAHALLDVSVDLSVEITQAFDAEILKAEAKVLVHAQLELVRHLHIIQAQILRFRRQLSSLLHACYVLRDQDVQRAQALGSFNLPRGTRNGSEAAPKSAPASSAATATGTPAVSGIATPAPGTGVGPAPGVAAGAPPPSATIPPSVSPSNLSSARPLPHLDVMTGNPHHNGLLPSHVSPIVHPPPPPPQQLATVPGAPAQAQGWFSPMAKVYMNDVIDHLEMVVSSSEQFVGTCDHLTDYCFNVLSFHTNNSMERLSIVTVVFLPLTFIASYFGMNFTDFPSLENPDSYFWRVAAPCTVAFFLIFSFSYLSSAWQTFKRRMERWGRAREIRAAKKRE